MPWQGITPELRQWILSQSACGRTADELLKAMLDRGWSEAVAAHALTDTLAADEGRQWRRKNEALAARAPRPQLNGSPASVRIDGREVDVLLTLDRPRLVLLGGFLSDEECDALIELARVRLERSETVVGATGGSKVNETRTSEGMFFERAENEVCARIERRIAALLNWPVQNGEGMQVLRYRRGAEYRPHYDYFDPEQPGMAKVLAHGGQRVATLVMYLNKPARGGRTVFPDVKLEISPLKGNAVFFSYDRPHPATASLHGGSPVLEGEKWVATKWLREREFV